ncbi:hypothetical protein JCM37172_20570 [Faecalimonas hominis]
MCVSRKLPECINFWEFFMQNWRRIPFREERKEKSEYKKSKCKKIGKYWYVVSGRCYFNAV